MSFYFGDNQGPGGQGPEWALLFIIALLIISPVFIGT